MLLSRIILILIPVLTLHLLIFGQFLVLIPNKTQVVESPQMVTVNLIQPSTKKSQKTVSAVTPKPAVKKKLTVKKKLKKTHSLKKTQQTQNSLSAQHSKKSKLAHRAVQKVTPTQQIISPKNKPLPKNKIVQQSPQSENPLDTMLSSQNIERLSQAQSFQRAQNAHPLNDRHQSQDAAQGSSSLKNPPQPKTVFTPPSFQAAYLHNPAPVYPRLSKRRGEQGQVLLRVQVTPQGHADRVNIKQSSGSVRLDKAAQQTVRQWRFVPAQKNGQPITAWVIVPIIFKLN